MITLVKQLGTLRNNIERGANMLDGDCESIDMLVQAWSGEWGHQPERWVKYTPGEWWGEGFDSNYFVYYPPVEYVQCHRRLRLRLMSTGAWSTLLWKRVISMVAYSRNSRVCRDWVPCLPPSLSSGHAPLLPAAYTLETVTSRVSASTCIMIKLNRRHVRLPAIIMWIAGCSSPEIGQLHAVYTEVHLNAM